MGIQASMMKIVEVQGLRSIKYVTPMAPGEETGLLAEVYPQIPEAVRALLHEHVGTWQGQKMGLGRPPHRQLVARSRTRMLPLANRPHLRMLAPH